MKLDDGLNSRFVVTVKDKLYGLIQGKTRKEGGRRNFYLRQDFKNELKEREYFTSNSVICTEIRIINRND